MLPSEFSEAIMLAIEMETLAEAGNLDEAADAQVLQLIEQDGATTLSAAIALAHLTQLEAERARRFWLSVPVPLRPAMAKSMLHLQPQMGARVLGVEVLCDVLQSTSDPQTAEDVVSALKASVVPESHRCLVYLSGSPRLRLGRALAERAGRSTGDPPPWMLDGDIMQDLLPAFCFGLLSGRHAERFPDMVSRFGLNDWSELERLVRGRATELSRTGTELYMAACEARLSKVDRGERRISHNRAVDQSSRPSGAARALCLRAEAADSGDIPCLIREASEIASPAWRREARIAILRRVLNMGFPVALRAIGLSRTEMKSEIAAFRVSRAEVRQLRRPYWREVSVERRFRVLCWLLRRPNDEISREENIDILLDAILELPTAMRNIVAERFLSAFGTSGSVTLHQLSRLTENGVLNEATLVLLGRTYALRGDSREASQVMQQVEAGSSRDGDAEAMRIIAGALNRAQDRSSANTDAINTGLLMLSGDRLLEALDVCRERLDEADYERLAADAIIRGRALESFAAMT